MIAAMARRISSPIIVGRTEELEALLGAAERGAAGDTETVVVRGEAGIGKSRLVLELGIEAAARGFELVVGGCPALVDSPLPFAPIVAATEALLRTRDESGVKTLLDGIGPDLVRIAPALGARFGVADPPPVPEALIPGRVFDAVRTLLQRAAADRPLVVVFEDLHWADPASLDLIGYLVRSRGWPGAIVLTYRSDELHRRHPLLPWIAELSRVPTVEVLELGRLGARRGRRPGGGDPRSVARDCARGRAGPAGRRQRVHHRGAAGVARPGRPDAAECGRHAGTPRPCRHAAGRRTSRRRGDVGRGRRGRRGHGCCGDLCAGPGRRGGAAVGARRAADRRGGRRLRRSVTRCCRRRSTTACCRASAVATTWPTPASLEAAAAPGQPASAARLAEVAHHALAADDLPLALRASVAAGRAALTAGAFVDASRHLERAVQLVDAVPDAASLVDGGRATVLRLAAEAASFTTDPARAVRLWEEAIELPIPRQRPRCGRGSCWASRCAPTTHS